MLFFPRKLVSVALAATALVAVAAPSTQAAKKKTTNVTFMSRNLFLGADLIPLATAKKGDEFEHAAGTLLNSVKATDPEGRMKLIAGEIAKAKPDLVGLQEVTLWKTGPKNDPAPASTVVIDYLASIKRELNARGAKYRVVADQRTLSLEGPTDQNVDLRFTDGNVVLARKGVKVSKSKSSDFKNQLQIPTQQLGTVSVNRSFNQLNASVRGAKLHLVNAHLEAYSPEFRLKQAKELVAGPLKSKLPTVLVGDLNSGPKLEKPEDRPPYAAIAKAGFKEARTSKPQCCFNDDLTSGTWDHIVDHIMAKPRLKVVRSFITGAETTSGGLHPSDHGGVVSVLRFPKR
jgi:endonuclease/exonuclease/phosphatase family metal-dependent hydrolase